ncbi:MAG: type II secretion system secretin GspD [Nitrospinota bacterium]
MKNIKLFYQVFLCTSIAVATLLSCSLPPKKKGTVAEAGKKKPQSNNSITGKTKRISRPKPPERDLPVRKVVHISGGNTTPISQNPKKSENLAHISGAETRVSQTTDTEVDSLSETDFTSKMEGKASMVPDEIDHLLLTNEKVAGQDQDFPELPADIASRSVILNFDKADIIEIVAMVAEVLEFDYIVEPGVGGKVTIHTTEKIEARELFPVLRQILSTNGVAIVKDGKYFKVTQMADAHRKPISTFLGKDGSPLPTDDTIIIQLVPLKYLPSEALQTVLTPLLSKTGNFLKFPTSNILGIIDTGSNIRRLLELIEILDTDVFGKVKIKLFPVRFGKAEDLNKELTEILDTVGLKEQKLFLKIVPIPRVNSLLAVAANTEYLKTIEMWIKKLDLPDTGAGSMATYIYKVQNGDAANIASLIQTLYKPGGSKKNQKKKGVKKDSKPTSRTRVKRTPGAQRKKARSVKISGITEIEGELQVVSDGPTNSVIIRTNPIYYPTIMETIRQLDVAPMQVMIEIMVAELTLDKSTQFGLEWAVRGGSAGYSIDHGSNLPANLAESFTNPGGAASYFVQDTGSILGLITLKASESKLNILSSPVILTSENKEASISITNSVPISSISTSATGIQTTSFQYTDAGIILKVTPKINSEKFVSMDVYQEVSQVGEKPPQAGASDPPPIFKRIAQTSVVVKDQQTLVIGGMIDSTQRQTKSKVPGLSSIPLIGKLFQRWTDSESKTELIILITPRVIETVTEAKRITEAFKKRIDFLQYEVNQQEVLDEKTKSNNGEVYN